MRTIIRQLVTLSNTLLRVLFLLSLSLSLREQGKWHKLWKHKFSCLQIKLFILSLFFLLFTLWIWFKEQKHPPDLSGSWRFEQACSWSEHVGHTETVSLCARMLRDPELPPSASTERVSSNSKATQTARWPQAVNNYINVRLSSSAMRAADLKSRGWQREKPHRWATVSQKKSFSETFQWTITRHLRRESERDRCTEVDGEMKRRTRRRRNRMKGNKQEWEVDLSSGGLSTGNTARHAHGYFPTFAWRVHTMTHISKSNSASFSLNTSGQKNKEIHKTGQNFLNEREWAGSWLWMNHSFWLCRSRK